MAAGEAAERELELEDQAQEGGGGAAERGETKIPPTPTLPKQDSKKHRNAESTAWGDHTDASTVGQTTIWRRDASTLPTTSKPRCK